MGAQHSSNGHASHHHGELGHVVPLKVYVTVLILLLILTVVTVAISRVDFGNWNLVVAMLIASVKAGFVALFFMHLKYENPLVWLYVVFPIVLLGTMLFGVFIDQPLRIPANEGAQVESVKGQSSTAGSAAPSSHSSH
jgi:cytochrome c oxidase subunit 4